MAYDERLAEDLRAALTRRAAISEKKMFGGLNGATICLTLQRSMTLL